MPKSKIFVMRIFGDTKIVQLCQEINEFLADGKTVINMDTQVIQATLTIAAQFIVTIIYEDPAPAGIVVRNSPAHIAPRIDPLSNYKGEIGHNALRDQCMNCPLHGMFGVPKDEEPDPVEVESDSCGIISCWAYGVDFQSAGRPDPCPACLKNPANADNQ